MPCRKNRPKSHALVSRICLLLLFWHTATVALHSRNRFSAVPHIIPASQVLSKNATAWSGQGLPERASAEQPLPPSEISRSRNGWPPWLLSWWACLWAFSGTTVSLTWAMPTAWENYQCCKQEQITEDGPDYPRNHGMKVESSSVHTCLLWSTVLLLLFQFDRTRPWIV